MVCWNLSAPESGTGITPELVPSGAGSVVVYDPGAFPQPIYEPLVVIRLVRSSSTASRLVGSPVKYCHNQQVKIEINGCLQLHPTSLLDSLFQFPR